MTDLITRWAQSTWNSVCASPPVHLAHHGITGPLFGNALVAGGAAIVTLACIVVALRMLVRPGEREPGHPKYRILDADR
jgi:hypothetical protein